MPDSKSEPVGRLPRASRGHPGRLPNDRPQQAGRAENAVPPTEPRDALHIAVAAVHGIQYLVTWNFRHIANASLRGRIESVCRDAGFEPPIICTPEELVGDDADADDTD